MWDAPISQSRPIDEAINSWVDKTGSEIVSVSSPSMFMQWMDAERITRLIVVSVMVTYIPAVQQIITPTQEVKVDDGTKQTIYGWEPVNT